MALAQELLAEEMTAAPVFESPTALADFLKLHFAGQPHESFVVMHPDAQHRLNRHRRPVPRHDRPDQRVSARGRAQGPSSQRLRPGRVTTILRWTATCRARTRL
jgi:hypothetical protein